MKKITVREWIKNYKEGKYDKENRETQIEAGWYDWFCKDSSLRNKTKNLSKIMRRITNDFILDNYYIWFKNNCPCASPLYDDVRFEPLENIQRNKLYFVIVNDCGYEKGKYAVCAARYDYKTEFYTNSLKELMDYINNTLGPELEESIKKEN